MTAPTALDVRTPAREEGTHDGSPRLLLGVTPGARMSRREHESVHGRLPQVKGRVYAPYRHPLVGELVEAGIGGRGGAGFPFGHKLMAVARARSRPAVVVNLAESEPAAQKDAVLATLVPHLVLDGAVVAARLVGAREAVIWVHRGSDAVGRSVRDAIRERRGDGVSLRVVEGPDRYVAGESSAIVRFLSGGPAKPTTAPPRVSEKGVGGRPTLLSNAETFAHVALVTRHGARWFREVGTRQEPGTMLVTVIGAVSRPGVLEVPFGTPVHEVIARAGGPTGPVEAVLTGGYGGRWAHLDTVARLPLSRAAFRAAGAELGVGLLALLPAGRCGLAETDRLVGWLAGESAGQCGPCTSGLPAMAGAFRHLVDAGDPASPALLSRWAGMVTGRGACHHPDGVASMVSSALEVFAGAVDQHVAGGGRASCSGCKQRAVLPLPPDEPAPRRWWRR